MAPRARSADLAAASAKLADRVRQVRHGHLFSVSIETRDGQKATVTWQIDTHREEALPYVLREIGYQFRVADAQAALVVLQTWTAEHLRAHLAQFTAAQLRPPSMRGHS